jgi:excisionase family DNA binding protein
MADLPKYKREPIVITTDAFTRDQVARQLGVSIRHVDRMIKHGNLRALKIGHLVRIPRASVDELLHGGVR